MLTRIIFILSLLITPVFADEVADKAEFKKLYAEFNELYSSSEDIDPIIEVAEKLIKIAPKAYGKNHMNTAVVTYNLASLYIEKDLEQHNVELENQTTILLEKYFKILDRIDAPKNRTYVNQFLVYLKASVDDHVEESIKSEARKIQKIAKELDYEPQELAKIENSLAHILFKNRQYQEAKDFHEDSNLNYEKAYGENHFKIGENLFSIAKIDMGWNKRELAEKEFLKALDIFEKNGELGNTLAQSTHAFLVALYEEMGNPDAATKHCQAVAIERPKDFDKEIDPLYRKLPDYPSTRREGYVLVEFNVDTNGNTQDVKILESSAAIFEKNSLEAISKWRYAPSVQNGELIITENAKARIEYRRSR
ncbi:TonB family protein [Pseudemcibacter aquimaris]|nr:TonB family protein [Pseudemcibacter aquimaris]